MDEFGPAPDDIPPVLVPAHMRTLQVYYAEWIKLSRHTERTVEAAFVDLDTRRNSLYAFSSDHWGRITPHNAPQFLLYLSMENSRPSAANGDRFVREVIAEVLDRGYTVTTLTIASGPVGTLAIDLTPIANTVVQVELQSLPGITTGLAVRSDAPLVQLTVVAIRGARELRDITWPDDCPRLRTVSLSDTPHVNAMGLPHAFLFPSSRLVVASALEAAVERARFGQSQLMAIAGYTKWRRAEISRLNRLPPTEPRPPPPTHQPPAEVHGYTFEEYAPGRVETRVLAG